MDTEGKILAILTQIQNDMNGLKQGQERLEERFDSLEKRLDSLEKRFDDLEKRFDDLEKRFDDLEKRFWAQEADIKKIAIEVHALFVQQSGDFDRLGVTEKTVKEHTRMFEGIKSAVSS